MFVSSTPNPSSQEEGNRLVEGLHYIFHTFLQNPLYKGPLKFRNLSNNYQKHLVFSQKLINFATELGKRRRKDVL